jgi:hypothetical protein
MSDSETNETPSNDVPLRQAEPLTHEPCDVPDRELERLQRDAEVGRRLVAELTQLAAAKKAKADTMRRHGEILRNLREQLDSARKSDDDGTLECGRRIKDAIVMAWQALDEAEALKASDTHEALSEIERIEDNLDALRDAAKQDTLFPLDELVRPARKLLEDDPDPTAELPPGADAFADGEAPDRGLETYALPRLRSMAKRAGIRGRSRMKRDELIAALKLIDG